MAYTSTTPGSGRTERSPGSKFLFMLLAGFLLSIPLLSVYLLNYDRQSRSSEARASIAEGWGGAQTIAGPLLIIPYRTAVTETVEENGKQVTRKRFDEAELTLSPDRADIKTVINPERRKRSIYETVVYEAGLTGEARFILPEDLERRGIPVDALILDRAQLRFGLSDVRGLQGGSTKVSLDGTVLKLEPGQGAGGAGFHAWADASRIRSGVMTAKFAYDFRGNGELALRADGADTNWTVTSPWPSPSFKGDFLPTKRTVSAKGFEANWKIGNLSLGQPAAEAAVAEAAAMSSSRSYTEPVHNTLVAQVDLVEPVDVYNQVDRATKYGFLFIGFTFVAFLMFDVIGGARVSIIEYLLVGIGLILFFVLLLAFAEVIGFAGAYALASGAVIGLITAYSASILKSWGRAKWIGAMLIALYTVLYVLLSLEAYSLLIGAVMLFLALAGVMYLTRNIDWSAKREAIEEVAA
jgi:inner membrane protein